jgi:hypothetical protein
MGKRSAGGNGAPTVGKSAATAARRLMVDGVSFCCLITVGNKNAALEQKKSPSASSAPLTLDGIKTVRAHTVE